MRPACAGVETADRYALVRLIPSVQAPAIESSARSQTAGAVFATFGLNGTDDDGVQRTNWYGNRLESRYIQCRITRRRERGARALVMALVEAVDRARAVDRSLILPDLAPKPDRHAMDRSGFALIRLSARKR